MLFRSTTTALVAATTSSGCAGVATRPIFRPFGDTSLYAAVVGGTMEPAGQSSWFLWPGASFVAENESYYLNSTTDKYSLRIPTGSFANAPWLCVGEDFPTARFVVKNTGTATGTLSVDVQYASADFSTVGNVHVGDVTAGAKWGPSATLPLKIPPGAAYYRVNFTAFGSGAVFQVDDLFIDPMRRSM